MCRKWQVGGRARFGKVGGQIAGGHSVSFSGASCAPAIHLLNRCLLCSVTFGTFLLALIRSGALPSPRQLWSKPGSYVAAGGHPSERVGPSCEKDAREHGSQARPPRSPRDCAGLHDTPLVIDTRASLPKRHKGLSCPPIRGIYKLLFNKWSLWKVLQGER